MKAAKVLESEVARSSPPVVPKRPAHPPRRKKSQLAWEGCWPYRKSPLSDERKPG